MGKKRRLDEKMKGKMVEVEKEFVTMASVQGEGGKREKGVPKRRKVKEITIGVTRQKEVEVESRGRAEEEIGHAQGK